MESKTKDANNKYGSRIIETLIAIIVALWTALAIRQADCLEKLIGITLAGIFMILFLILNKLIWWER